MVMLNPALAPAASVLIMQLTVPPLPTAGLVQVNAGPEVCNSETNVAPTGNGSVIDTFAASLAKFVMVQLTVPLPPTAGVVHANVGPAVCVTETNVMPTGTLSVSETVCAPLGPLFVRLTVYVAVIPGVTVAGPDLVTARSAEPTIVVVTEELSFPGFGSMPIGVLVAVAVFVTVAPGRSAAGA